MANKKDNVRFTISVSPEINEKLENLSQEYNKRKSDIAVLAIEQAIPLVEKLLAVFKAKDSETQIGMMMKMLDYTYKGIKEDTKELKKELDTIKEKKKKK